MVSDGTLVFSRWVISCEVLGQYFVKTGSPEQVVDAGSESMLFLIQQYACDVTGRGDYEAGTLRFSPLFWFVLIALKIRIVSLQRVMIRLANPPQPNPKCTVLISMAVGSHVPASQQPGTCVKKQKSNRC